MKTQTKTRKIVSVILIMAALALNIAVLCMEGNSIYLIVCTCLASVSLVAALQYVLMGSGKNAAKFLRLFTVICAVAQASNCLYVAHLEPIGIAFTAVSLILLLILAFWKDLGQRNTMAICGLLLAVKAFGVIGSLVKFHAFDGTVCRAAAETLLAVVLLLCYQAKYRDKAARGRKLD